MWLHHTLTALFAQSQTNSSLQGGAEEDYRISHGLPNHETQHLLIFPMGGLLRTYRTPICDLADLQERICAAANNATPQMLHNACVEVENRLAISRATTVSHVEVCGT